MLARLGVSLVGAGLLVAGAAAVFVTTNSAGASALVAAGTVLVAVAVFTNRLESVEGAGVKVQLGAVAEKLREADQADAQGDSEQADRLRLEARLLLTAMEPLATRYEELREGSPSGRERNAALGELVEQAQKMAEFDFINASAVENLFRSGRDGNRITALGLMLGDLRLVSVPLITEVIRRPRSSFEQWHALRLSLDLARREDHHAQYEAIREAISAARASGSLGRGRDRSRIRMAERVQAAMERHDNPNKPSTSSHES